MKVNEVGRAKYKNKDLVTGGWGGKFNQQSVTKNSKTRFTTPPPNLKASEANQCMISGIVDNI